MAFCRNCGAQLSYGTSFCPTCGTPVANPAQQPDPAFHRQNNPIGDPDGFSAQDAKQNKVMAILAYLGILVLVPIFTAKESRFARFHANQGLILLICEAAYTVIYRIVSTILNEISSAFSLVSALLGLVSVLFLVLVIIGIVNAAGGKMKKLPVIGDFRILK